MQVTKVTKHAECPLTLLNRGESTYLLLVVSSGTESRYYLFITQFEPVEQLHKQNLYWPIISILVALP